MGAASNKHNLFLFTITIQFSYQEKGTISWAGDGQLFNTAQSVVTAMPQINSEFRPDFFVYACVDSYLVDGSEKGRILASKVRASRPGE